MPLCKQIKRKAQLTASLLVKLTPRNVNLGNGRFAMFNKERDILLLQEQEAYCNYVRESFMHLDTAYRAWDRAKVAVTPLSYIHPKASTITRPALHK